MENMRAYISVQKWIDNVNRYDHLEAAAWEGRLRTLEECSQHIDKDPDTMISEALEKREVQIECMRRLKQFARQVCHSPRAAHDWENVVLSFFIHNGARVIVQPYTK